MALFRNIIFDYFVFLGFRRSFVQTTQTRVSGHSLVYFPDTGSIISYCVGILRNLFWISLFFKLFLASKFLHYFKICKNSDRFCITDLLGSSISLKAKGFGTEGSFELLILYFSWLVEVASDLEDLVKKIKWVFPSFIIRCRYFLFYQLVIWKQSLL